MTTIDGIPGFRDYAVMRLASAAKKRAHTTAQVSGNALQAIVRVVLHIAGFALLTLAGFQFNIIAGYIVAGISCFVFSTLMSGGAEQKAPADPMLRG